MSTNNSSLYQATGLAMLAKHVCYLVICVYHVSHSSMPSKDEFVYFTDL